MPVVFPTSAPPNFTSKRNEKRTNFCWSWLISKTCDPAVFTPLKPILQLHSNFKHNIPQVHTDLGVILIDLFFFCLNFECLKNDSEPFPKGQRNVVTWCAPLFHFIIAYFSFVGDSSGFDNSTEKKRVSWPQKAIEKRDRSYLFSKEFQKPF